jgi:3-isopropylmalate dehydrogenase
MSVENRFEIAVLPGDGTGPELTQEVLKTLKTAQDIFNGFSLEFSFFEAGAGLYLRTGEILPQAEFDTISKSDAIYKAPVGLPEAVLPDGTEAGMTDVLLRSSLDLWANVRPVKLRPGVTPILKDVPAGFIDYVVVRENTEGLYSAWNVSPQKATQIPAPAGMVLRDEVAMDNLVVTRKASERIIRYAFELAESRGGCPQDGTKRVTCVDKANVLKSYAFFRKIYDEVAVGYPQIEKDYAYIDAMTQWQVRTPAYFDVVVAENLFGDIISDLAAATVGSVGMGPGANIGDHIAMFEPIHGSAPKYAGMKVANPIASILSAAMMMDWLSMKHKNADAKKAANLIEKAVDEVLLEGVHKTYDLGGKSKTDEMGDAIVTRMEKLAAAY